MFECFKFMSRVVNISIDCLPVVDKYIVSHKHDASLPLAYRVLIS